MRGGAFDKNSAERMRRRAGERVTQARLNLDQRRGAKVHPQHAQRIAQGTSPVRGG
jgi:hypothetical protein